MHCCQRTLSLSGIPAFTLPFAPSCLPASVLGGTRARREVMVALGKSFQSKGMGMSWGARNADAQYDSTCNALVWTLPTPTLVSHSVISYFTSDERQQFERSLTTPHLLLNARMQGTSHSPSQSNKWRCCCKHNERNGEGEEEATSNLRGLQILLVTSQTPSIAPTMSQTKHGLVFFHHHFLLPPNPTLPPCLPAQFPHPACLPALLPQPACHWHPHALLTTHMPCYTTAVHTARAGPLSLHHLRHHCHCGRHWRSCPHGLET
jgi:hypothetical protein